MQTHPSPPRFNAQRSQLVTAAIVLLLMIVGTLIAILQHLPTDADEQGIHSGVQAALMNGTVLSPPTILLALFVVFLGLSFLASRSRRAGLVGTIGVSLLAFIALLATTSDEHWRQLLDPGHFDLLKSPLALISFVALLLTVLFGILSVVQRRRMQSREARR